MGPAKFMKCNKCGNEIPAERLEILPNTTTCVKCSTVQRIKGNMVFEKKMASEMVLRQPGAGDPFKGSTFRR